MALDAFITYLDSERNYATHTLEAYKVDMLQFKSFLKLVRHNKKIETAQFSDVRAWVVSLVNKKMHPTTVNRKIATLKSYYRFLQKIGEIETNPAQAQKRLKQEKKARIPFSYKEIAAALDLFQDANTFEALRDKLLITLLYSTGIRRNELIELKLTQVSVASKQIKVLGKRNKERIVPLLDAVLPEIETYLHARSEIVKPEGVPYFFLTKKGFKMYPSLVYRIVKLYFSKVSEKVKKSPHILRHSFATHLLEQGAHINAVKELLGHASLQATQLYTHADMSYLKEVCRHSHPRNQKQ